MKFGVYRHRRTGHLYQFLLLARDHETGDHVVVYIPLRIEPEWAGTIRPCCQPRDVFEKKFEYVGEGLPTIEIRTEDKVATE